MAEVCRDAVKHVNAIFISPDDNERIKKMLGTSTIGVVFAWGDDILEPGSMNVVLSFLQVTKSLLSSLADTTLFVITSGALSVAGEGVYNPEAAVLHGMAKTLKNENLNLSIKCVDLEHSEQALSMDNVHPSNSEFYQLLYELGFHRSTSLEEARPFQVAYRAGVCYAPVFKSCALSLNQNQLTLPAGCKNYHLVLPSSRNLSHLQFLPHRPNGEIDEHQIEVQVHAYSLNFKDLLTILKPSEEFENLTAVGRDFSGVVIKVGSKAVSGQSFKVGDRVFGLNSEETQLASSLVLKADYVCRIPQRMTFSEAATLPMIFSTAYHSLVTLAGIRKADTVLIHTASGGVGLTAIQLCQHVGAVVIATGGTPKKRAFLKSLGVAHVFESRNLSYAPNILEVTGGKGVDVVMNSLTGPGFKEATLEVCAQNARFVEISKRSIWKTEDVMKLRPDIKYNVVDLSIVSPVAASFFLSKLESFLEEGILKPIPVVRFDAVHVRQALEYFKKATHLGKIVCTMWDTTLETPGSLPLPKMASLFNTHSTYLITGGLGGVGIKVCQWMLQNGATDMVLVGRKPPTPQIASIIKSWQNSGNSIEVIRSDIGEFNSCKRMFDEISQLTKPLRGIMHCAGAAIGALYQNQDASTFTHAFLPKVSGTWNLHILSKDLQLEHFVLFSSMTALFGPKGQANYVAANSFQDAFAHYRNYLGLPATSINWGLWGKVGLAKDVNVLGIRPVSVERMLRGLECVLRIPITQICLADFSSFSDFTASHPLAKTYFDSSLFVRENVTKTKRTIADDVNETTEGFWGSMEKLTEASAKLGFLRAFLSKLIQYSLGLNTQELVDISATLVNLGMDSLLLLEFRNRVLTIIGPKLQAHVNIFTSTGTVQSLASNILSIVSMNQLTYEPQKTETARQLKRLLVADCILPNNIVVPSNFKQVDPPSKIATILLTGATGFLGGYIASVLCSKEYESVKRVVCLVRETSKVKNSVDILASIHSPTMLPCGWKKLECLIGDFTASHFGISAEMYEKLSMDIDAIIHCAATTNHVDPYTMIAARDETKDIRVVNVLGTLNILEFACAAKIKHVYFASTFLSIGTFLDSRLENELSDDWPTTQMIDWAVENKIHGYPVSKFVCEVLLHQANLRGIPCKVFRLPHISGDSITAKIIFKQNHIVRRLLTDLQINAIPKRYFPLNNLPVDFCAKITLELFFCDRAPLEIYLMIHPRAQMQTEYFPQVAQEQFGRSLDILGHVEYAKRLEHRITPLDAFKEMYTDIERLKAIYALKSLKKYMKNTKYFVNHKMLRHVPNYGANLKAPVEYLRRDLLYAQANGFFGDYLN